MTLFSVSDLDLQHYCAWLQESLFRSMAATLNFTNTCTKKGLFTE
jgi:hypothetical protein